MTSLAEALGHGRGCFGREGVLRCTGTFPDSHRGDKPQAERLEQWLAEVLQTYSDRLLHIDGDNFASYGLRLLNPFQAC